MREQAHGAGESHDELEDTLTESSPMAAPRYANPQHQELGEQLATLYTARDEAEGEARERIALEIAALRGAFRKGPRLHAGEFLADGRYRLLDRLGLDTESARWLAYDRAQRRLVTLAVIYAPWADDEAQIESMVARARRLAEVDHPQVAHVLEGARSDEGFAYVASRYCGQADLHEVVAQGGIGAVDAVQVALELADGLGAVHARGLIHGAITPQAVVLSEEGGAHLTGFRFGPVGPAQSLYAAPEAISPAHADDPRGDVYALGMTVLYALHGEELPFWVVRDAGRLVDSLQVSDTVKDALRVATSWDPEARYAEPQALSEALLADDALLAELADRAYLRERFAVAAAHYERLLALRPAEAVALQTRLGEVYLRLDAHDEAFRHLTTALEQAVATGSTLDAEQAISPQITLLERQADLTQDAGRLVSALVALAGKLIGPRRAVIYSHLARAQEDRLGDLPAAEQSWARVLEEHHTPELARLALTSLARIAEAQEAWTDFIHHSTALLPYLSPQERPRIQFNIGRACIEHTGDEDVGLSWIDRAEAGGLRTLELCETLEHLRARRGQWPQVIELMMRRAQVLDAEQVSRLLLRAGFMARSVHLDGLALEVYQELLRRVPRHVVALRELARLHYRAREPKAALQYFEALHDPRAARGTNRPDEAEAGERATDLLAHARLLLRAGQADEASSRLNEALELVGDLVPALRLVAPLELARGRVEQAGQVWERLLALHTSLDQEPHRVAACVGLGDVAWIQGKLAMARGYYNRAIEVDPDCALAWWGIARTGLAARGGHPGLERAPWLGATPSRITPPESLARLFISLLDEDAMRRWLAWSAVGTALLSGGDCTIRVALAVVDVMLYHGLVDRELFSRLTQARPEWKPRIDAVADQFFGVSREVDEFGIYLGPAGAVRGDFDRAQPRKLLPWVGLDGLPALPGALLSDEAFQTLTAGEAPPAPDPREPETAPMSSDPRPEPRQIGALLRDGRAWAVLDVEANQVVVGSSRSADVHFEHAQAAAEQLVLYRVGKAIYLRAERGVRVDGEPAQRRRLEGGEAVELCEVPLEFVRVSDLDALPPAYVAPEDSDPTALFQAATPEELRAADAPEALETGIKPSELSEEAHTEKVRVVGPEEGVDLGSPGAPARPDPSEDPAAHASEPAAEPKGSPEAAPETLAAEADPTPEPDPSPGPIDAASDLPAEEPLPAVASASGEPEADSSAPTPQGAEAEEDDDEASGPSAGQRVKAGADIESVVEQVRAAEAQAAGSEARAPVDPTDQDPAPVTEPDPPAPSAFLAPPEPMGGIAPERLSEATPEPARSRKKGRRKSRTPAPPPLRPRDPTPNPAARHAELIRRRMRRMETYKPPSDAEPRGSTPPGVSRSSVPPAEPRGASPADTQVVAPPVMPPAPEPDEASAVTQIAAPPEAPAPEAALASPAGTPRAVVEVMSGPARGSAAEVETILRIGSSPENELAIAGDGRLEAHHCTVVRTADGFVLRDAGSDGGTVMNGTRVEADTDLCGGEVIMVGRTVLRFRQLD